MYAVLEAPPAVSGVCSLVNKELDKNAPHQEEVGEKWRNLSAAAIINQYPMICYSPAERLPSQ